VEKMVKEMEDGEVKLRMCMNYSDWIEGEWINKKIERYVEE
jgi:hypothetical protein